MNNKCVIVVGPTASGKSALAINLAIELNGVIISADSMQIYRKMNIGTAKSSIEEMALVPHKLIDIVDIDTSFSVADYKIAAEKAIDEALKDNKLPIICGGTGLYIDALINNTEFCEINCDPQIRISLEKEAAENGGAGLLSRLHEIDPETATKLHVKDLKRIIRALEVFLSTGKTLTYFNKLSRQKPAKYDFCIIYLCFEDREHLYERINSRVDIMLANGLEDETRSLLKEGLLEGKTASQAIGYKELLGYIKGETDFNEAVALLKQRTRNYAKRQMTWFNRYKTHKIFIDKTNFSETEAIASAISEAKKEVTEFLKK